MELENIEHIENGVHDDDNKTKSSEDSPSSSSSQVASAKPLSAYIGLAGSVIGLSSIGPLFALQTGIDPTLKTAWRSMATTFSLIPLAAYAAYRDGFPSLSRTMWLQLVLASVCFSICLITFAGALDHTTVGNTVILSHSKVLILLTVRLVMGDSIERLEGGGALLGFFGVLLCVGDSADRTSALDRNSLYGDFMALSSAIFSLVYMELAKQIRPHLDLTIFMCCIMGLATVTNLLIMAAFGRPFFFDLDVDQGVFGWMNVRMDRLHTEIALVFICSLLGTMGFVGSMKYFSNLTLSTAVLIEPLLAEFMAFFLGSGSLPGLSGWIGNALVIVGTYIVLQAPTTEKKIH